MRTVAVLAIALIAGSGIPQSVADALRGPARTYTAADLPDGYRAVTLMPAEGPGSGFSSLFFLQAGENGERDPQTAMFFSLLNVSFVDPDEFAQLLDGKRPRIRAFTMNTTDALVRRPGTPGITAPTFVESWIEAGRIQQWTPKPAITKAAILAVFAPPTPGSQADKQRTVEHAKQLALGTNMYALDYDDHLPLADSTAKAQAIVMPYVKNAETWKSYNPKGARLLYNVALSNLTTKQVPKPERTPLFFDEADWPDGGRAVAYLDGHADFLTEEAWVRLWDDEIHRRDAIKAAKIIREGKLPPPTRTKATGP